MRRCCGGLGWAALALALVASGATPAAAGPDCAMPRHARLDLFATELGVRKRIVVHLPRAYACEGRRDLAAVYLNDGHDLFDWNPDAAALEPRVAAEIARREAWYGSWRLDRQLDRAEAERVLPPLVVIGIAADDGRRSEDLVPVPLAADGDARGEAFGRFIARTVVPTVEAVLGLRVRPGCRVVGGASLGALSALQVGLAHRDRFDRIVALSPVLRPPALAAWLDRAWRLSGPGRPRAVLFDLDDDPPGATGRRLLDALLARAPADGAVLRTTDGARHDIRSWSQRVVPALAAVLGAGCAPAAAPR